MRPPETAVPRAGNIVESICVGVMISVVRNPCTGSTRSVKHGKENKQLFDDRIQLDSAMRQRAMVTDRCSKGTQAGENQRRRKHLPTGHWKQHDSKQG